MITGKINCSRINKNLLFKGAKGTYLDIVCFPLKSGMDNEKNTHVIFQSVSKADREKGIKGEALGRMRIDQPRNQPDLPSAAEEAGEEEIPF